MGVSYYFYTRYPSYFILQYSPIPLISYHHIYIIILNYFFRFPVFLFAVYRLSNGSQMTGSQ